MPEKYASKEPQPEDFEDFDEITDKTRFCPQCGGILKPNQYTDENGRMREITPKKYCSLRCCFLANRPKRVSYTEEGTCYICGKTFMKPQKKSVTCEDPSCQAENKRRTSQRWYRENYGELKKPHFAPRQQKEKANG